MVAQPRDFPQLNVEQEITALRDALEDPQTHAKIEIEEIKDGTLECLQNRLLQTDKPIHILHFIGHGGHNSESGERVLLFETGNKQSQHVTSDRFTILIKDHSSLKLVFLNACESATGSEEEVFSGFAQQLVRGTHSTLMAVIAMQFRIEDQVAIRLAYNFYAAIAACYPVDAALAEARKAIYIQGENYGWGTPVLFMRSRSGILFDIPISAQYPGFELLTLEELEKDAYKIERKTSKKLLNILRNNHILILSEEPHITLQILARQVAYELHKEYPNFPILEWQEEPEKLYFKLLFPLQEKISRARNDTIFIIPEISHELFSGNYLAELLPLLRERSQYLILTTVTSRNKLAIDISTAKLWAEQETTIYNKKYLLSELEKRIKANEKRLPEHLLNRLKDGDSELGYSLSRIAVQLRLPIHMDTFVERLCNQEEQIKKSQIKRLIDDSIIERDQDRIRYLYHRLPQRSDQLLVVGLCLLGGATETQFFQLLERIIKSCWQYAFTEVEILDYYHLDHLHNFFKYDVQGAKQYPAERTILPQYTNQWWHLLLIIWESHRNHLRKTFAELAAIIIDSISDQREEYGNEQQRQRLRVTIGTLFSNVGRIALPSVEHTLLDLASHQRPSAQALVADAIARWYDQNEKGDARERLFKLLQRWLSQNWSQESNWNANQRDQRYVRLTIARTLNQVLDKVTDPMPEPLPELLLDMLDSDEKVEKFFNTNISRKIFPSHTSHLIQCWQKVWDISSKAEVANKWLQVIYIIAPHCKRHNQLPLIAPLLVDVLAHGIQKYGTAVITLLQDNRYLIKAVFPANIVKLNEDGTLLYLVRFGTFEPDILDVLLDVNRSNFQTIQSIIEQWRIEWSPHCEQIKELAENSWYNVLSLIGKFYDDIDQFVSFQVWLPSLIEEGDMNTQSQLVEVLYRIGRYQRGKIENTAPNELDAVLIPTGAERIAYAWLSDEQIGAAFHLIVFWFSAKMLDVIDRRSIHRNFNKTFYLKSFIPFCVSPFARRYRVIVGNLLPVVDRLFQDKPEEINKIIRRWTKNSNNAHARQVGHRLQWALWLCFGVKWLGTQFSRISKSK